MAFSKRNTLQLLSIGLLAPELAAKPKQLPDGWVMEEQRGDPDMKYEVLKFDKAALGKNHGVSKATYLPRIAAFPDLLLKEAAAWIGKNRRNAREEISDFLALYDLPFAQGGSPIPFCAAGISYVAAAIYATTDPVFSSPVSPGKLVRYLGDLDHHHFDPSPSVHDLYHSAVGDRRWVDKSDTKTKPKPGWLVVFNFGKQFDHVGILERVEGGKVHSIDFNTVVDGATGSQRDGGAIARKARNVSVVRGYIDTSKRSGVA